MSRLELAVEDDRVLLSLEFSELFEYLADCIGFPSNRRVSLVLAPKELMRELKREHFCQDVDTDVIAFPTDFPELSEEADALAGEIFLGAEMVAENALEESWSSGEEFVFVLAHGLLHLAGWSDEAPAERRAMFDRQKELLARVEQQGYDTQSIFRYQDLELMER